MTVIRIFVVHMDTVTIGVSIRQHCTVADDSRWLFIAALNQSLNVVGRYLKTAISKLRCSYNYWFYEVTLMATTLRFVEVEREQCSYQGGL